MANVSFNINAIDRTRAAFASVERGLKRLDDRAKGFRRTAGGMGTALATALGLNINAIAEGAAEKFAELTSGMSKEDVANLDAANAMREAAMDIADKRRQAAMTDEQRLADLLKREERTRASIAQIGNEGYADTRKRAEAELLLQQILEERDDLQRSLAPDMEKITAEAKAAETAAGKAMGKVLGPTLSVSERVDALNGRLSRLQYELAQIDSTTPEGLQKRAAIFRDMEKTAEGLVDATADYNEELERSRQLANEVGGRMAASFENAVFSGGRLRDMLRGIADDLARLIFQKTITNPLASFISSGFSSVFGGGKASGGAVSAGTSYKVGENGEEVFTPNVAGRIIPNHKMGATSSAGAVVVNNYNSFSSGLQAAQILPLLDQNRRATIAEIQDLRARRKIA